MIGDQTFVVAQQAAGAAQCSYAIKPDAASVAFGGGPVTVAVSTGTNCSWTAASNVPWLTVGGSGAGIGNASITIDAAANTGAGRSGTVTIAERTLHGHAGGRARCAVRCTRCNPRRSRCRLTAGSTTVAVQTTSGCSWTATSNVAWLTIGGTGAGTGNAVVTVTASANTGASRTGTATIAGQMFTVTQAGGCDATIAPTSERHRPSKKGDGRRLDSGQLRLDHDQRGRLDHVTRGTTAAATEAWGHVAANTGPGRTDTMSIAGQMYAVTQAAAAPAWS